MDDSKLTSQDATETKAATAVESEPKGDPKTVKTVVSPDAKVESKKAPASDPAPAKTEEPAEVVGYGKGGVYKSVGGGKRVKV